MRLYGNVLSGNFFLEVCFHEVLFPVARFNPCDVLHGEVHTLSHKFLGVGFDASLIEEENQTGRFHFEVIRLKEKEHSEDAYSFSDTTIRELQQKVFTMGLPLKLDFAARFNHRNPLKSSPKCVASFGDVTSEKIYFIRSLIVVVSFEELKRRFFTVLESLEQEPFMKNKEPYWMLGGLGKSSHWLESVAVAKLSHWPVGYIDYRGKAYVEQFFGRGVFDVSSAPLDVVNIVMIDDVHYSGAQLGSSIDVMLKYLSDMLSGRAIQSASKLKVNFFIYGVLMHPHAVTNLSKDYNTNHQNNLALALTYQNVDVSIIIKHTEKNDLRCAADLLNKNVMKSYALTPEEFVSLVFNVTQGLMCPEWKYPDDQSMSCFFPKILGIVPCDNKDKPYYLDKHAIEDLEKQARGQLL